jgi:glutamate-1-semialdehyde 2,1-aminomutase
MTSKRAAALNARAHELIPGGGHTYAKGDDQYPADAPPFLARGAGCHVWDLDDHEYIEYGAGLRAVTLGHAYPSVLEAARLELERGMNFVRPSPLEVECAAALLAWVPGAEMCKFAKNGSDVTTAAVKLARAFTGRDLVAICADQPFFSTDDWFIGTTAMAAGIPQADRDLTVGFKYNDLASVDALFERYPGKVACLVLEAATAIEPAPGFLEGLKARCDRAGALLVFDEMITGFRWPGGSAQAHYGVRADLSTFGKGLANGFPVSALVGRRDVMELGGLRHDKQRVFLLSTTHGAETVGLAAAMATICVYREHPVIDTLHAMGERLRAGVQAAAQAAGVADQLQVLGRASNLVYVTRDKDGKPSQAFRTLFMQQLIRRGIIGPSFVVNYSHQAEDIDRTIAAVQEIAPLYAKALADGPEKYTDGRPVKPVFRTFN